VPFLCNGNAERDEVLVEAAAPFLGRLPSREGGIRALLCTAGWAEQEHDEGHLKRALNRAGLPSHIEGGFDQSLVNLSLFHELRAVWEAAPELRRAWDQLREAISAAREFYLAHNAHLTSVLRRALVEAKRRDPALSFARLAGDPSSQRAPDLHGLLRAALARELHQGLLGLEHNDDRLASLVDAIEARTFDSAGIAFHPAWRAARQRLEQKILAAPVLFFLGGRLDLLLEGLRFFQLRAPLAEALRQGALIVAMSAGAMVFCERIIVYDDFAAQRREFQLFDRGLGLIRACQLFPHCTDRIQTDDPDNLSYLARRFQSRVCVGLNQRSFLFLEDPPRAQSVGPDDGVYIFDPSGQKLCYDAGHEIPLG
jgi:cyanophycinase-like exopeptidase